MCCLNDRENLNLIDSYHSLIGENRMLVSSRDKKIYFFDVTSEYAPIGVLNCAAYYESYVTTNPPLVFDISKSSSQLRVASGVLEDALTVQYYDMTKPDVDLQQPVTKFTSGVESAWATVSILSADDVTEYSFDSALSTHFNADLAKITSIDNFMIASYSNGSCAFSKGGIFGKQLLAAHVPGSAPEVCLMAGGNFMATSSAIDGTICVWRLI